MMPAQIETRPLTAEERELLLQRFPPRPRMEDHYRTHVTIALLLGSAAGSVFGTIALPLLRVLLQ